MQPVVASTARLGYSVKLASHILVSSRLSMHSWFYINYGAVQSIYISLAAELTTDRMKIDLYHHDFADTGNRQDAVFDSSHLLMLVLTD